MASLITQVRFCIRSKVQGGVKTSPGIYSRTVLWLLLPADCSQYVHARQREQQSTNVIVNVHYFVPTKLHNFLNENFMSLIGRIAAMSSLNETNCSAGNTTDTVLEGAYRYALVTIYTVVLAAGISGIMFMIDILKSNVRSVTTMAVLNLIVAHALFLLTVPFRIYFYASNNWALGPGFCKVISLMIHAHMYIAFIFYIIILVVRYVTFFSQRDRLEFYRRVHALAASLAVWVVTIGVILPVAFVEYGEDVETNRNKCFDFGMALSDIGVAVINYLLCAVLLLVTFVLLAVQLWILGFMYKKYGKTALSHQEFWAQIKSLCFVMIILSCFASYHAFRIYYVTTFLKDQNNCHLHGLQRKNEIFLAVTAFSCCDMLFLIDRKRWRSILSQYCRCL